MSGEEHSTRTTVLVAGAANLFVAAIKVAAGILTGSSALLAEAAHSAADTLNQLFLLASLRQGRRPADARHPFGYGQERYFWSLLAAFGIFVAGAGFSVFEGILALARPGHGQDVLVGYIVLAVSGAAEATSFARALVQSRGQARSRHLSLMRPPAQQPRHHRQGGPVRGHRGHDRPRAGRGRPAAPPAHRLAGVGRRRVDRDRRAAGGGGRPAWPGQPRPAAGRAADPADQRLIRDRIEEKPGVDELLELLTMYMGPDRLIVAARVAFSDGIGADAVEDLAEQIDRELSGQLSATPHVFIDPTDTARGSRGGAGRPAPLLPEAAD